MPKADSNVSDLEYAYVVGSDLFALFDSKFGHLFAYSTKWQLQDLQVQKVDVIDDDNFLNHLESCTPTRFSTPVKNSPKV